MIKIIFIEDDPGVAHAFEVFFSQNDCLFKSYNDGRFLLNDLEEVPDVFVIDRQLPFIDGLDLCRIIKASERLKNIPVIIFSANPFVKNEAFLSGADLFEEKPVSPARLMKDILDLINKDIQH